MTPRLHYTVVCKTCGRIVMKTRRSKAVPRPVRYGLCGLHRKPTIWNYREAPLR